MAAQTTKQQWEEAVARVINLSSATIERNAELESKVSQLELELSVWKQHAERERQTHNVQVTTLNRQLASLNALSDPLILCILDGNTNIFRQELLAQGSQGGRQAAQELTKSIAEYLTQEGVQVFGRLSFWTTIYVNRRRLSTTLALDGTCPDAQLDSFLTGFSQASPRFTVVDIGHGKDDTDVKIKEHVQTYLRFPQTLKIFFGGHDDTYVPTLEDAAIQELLGKLVIIGRERELGDRLKQMALPTLQVEQVFRESVGSSVIQRPGPIPLSGLNSNVTTVGGLISPQSDGHISPPAPGQPSAPFQPRSKPIDPTKPLHKQIPPPCNEFYLMTCTKGINCRYSHEWDLKPDMLEQLKRSAKKAPCNYLKNGLECPHGDRCCWGHVCPSGARCFHLSKGKCWFKGENMHPPIFSADGSPIVA